MIKGGNNLMYTFTIVVHIVTVYIILLPPFNNAQSLSVAIEFL